MKTPVFQNKLNKLKEDFSLFTESLLDEIYKNTDNETCDFWLIPYAEIKSDGFDITDYNLPTVDSYNAYSRYKCYHIYLIKLCAAEGKPYLLLYGQCSDEQGVEDRPFTLIELNFENRLLAIRLLEIYKNI